MKRITGRYGALKAATTTLEVIQGIDYRVASVDGAIVLAFDHESGVVVSTGFYEIDDFRPVTIRGKVFQSDYHDIVLNKISESVAMDKEANDAADAHSEQSHP